MSVGKIMKETRCIVLCLTNPDKVAKSAGFVGLSRIQNMGSYHSGREAGMVRSKAYAEKAKRVLEMASFSELQDALFNVYASGR